MHRWQDRVLIYSCLHYSPQELSDDAALASILTRDVEHNHITDLQRHLVIMDLLGEAVTPDMAVPLQRRLEAQGAMVTGLFMAADRPWVNYHYDVIADWSLNNCNWLERFQQKYPMVDCVTRYKLICLNRRDSEIRTRTVQFLQQAFAADTMLISLQSNWRHAGARTVWLDGPVYDRRQHEPPPERFLQAAVKIITEGSEANGCNLPAATLMSEKTFKCFAWHQFPIWVTVPGTVAAVRELGYDVFDDVFDGHVYDTIADQEQRLASVFDLILEKLSCNTDTWAGLRQKFWQRLCDNADRARRDLVTLDRRRTAAIQRHTKIFADCARFVV